MSDIETVLRQTTPESLPELDVAALRRRGRRRRTAKRTGAAGFIAVVVLSGIVLPAWLRTPEPIRFAEQPTAWAELDYQSAVTRLRETARVKAAVPPAADGKRLEVRVVGTVGRGVVDEQGEAEEWMLPFEVRVREGHDSFRGVYDRYEDRIEHGVTLEEVRQILAELPPPGGPTMTVDRDAEPPKPRADQPPTPSAIEEAEELATKPDPYVPSPEETKRPDRAYAFVRLSDALRQIPLELPVLDRGYAVLAALGETWVTYRGLTQDLLGRQAVAFSAVDPANNSEQWLLFDPDTGRVWGELTYQLLEAGPQFRGGAAVEYLEVEAR